MNRRQFLSTATSSLATLALASSATAQEDNNTTQTTTDDPEPRQIARTIDPNTRIREWDYQNGEFHIVLESDTVSTVTASEQIGRDRAGSGRFGIRQARVTNGNPVELTLPAEKVDGKAVVTLTTAASINQGYGIFLQAGNGFDLFNGPATWRRTAIASGSVFFGTAWGTKRYKEAKEDEAERRQMEVVE